VKTKPPSALTTRAATKSESRNGAWAGAAIRWLYPEPRLAPLCPGHLIGRDAACHSVLEGPEVSRKHAQIVSQGLALLVRDLGSRNGVYVDGARVQEAPLGPGSVLRIGAWLGLVLEVPQDALPAPPPLRELHARWYAGAGLERALAELESAARSDISIVIEGETGTGKEGIARAVHAWSARAGELIAVDCGALPEQLAESELFGYRKGAFSGAESSQPGLIRAAHQGTLFLDEVLNLSPTLQAKLLRVLEERRVRPVGETKTIPVDLRVICAAQEPLAVAARRKAFRSDLVGRLDGHTFRMPPLRERRQDIVPLFLRLLQDRGGAATACDAKLLEALLLHDWPLNVRELVRVVERLIAVHGTGPYKRAMLPDLVLDSAGRGAGRGELDDARPAATATPAKARAGAARKPANDTEELALLLESLRQHGDNLTRAAAALGMERSRANRILSAFRTDARARRKREL